MRLTQSDHTLQLPRRGCNPLFLGSRVDTGFTHLDVACNQGVGGVFGEDWVDLGTGVGDVCRENIDGLDVSIFALPHEREHTIISCPAVSGLSSRYRLTRCLARRLSLISSTLSSTRYNRSNREIRVGGRSILAGMGNLGSYRELIGLAAARIEVRALSVVMIPALAMETVCCSYTSAPCSSR